MAIRTAAPRTRGRFFSPFRLLELENRLVPSAVQPKLSLFDVGDVYSAGEYSSSVQRYTDRIVLGLDDQTAQTTLTQLIAPGGALDGFRVVQSLESGIQVLATPTPAGQSAEVQYVELESRMASLSGQSGVQWSAPVFHDVATGTGWMVATNEVIVALRPGVSQEQFFHDDGRFVSWRPLSGTFDQFVATTSNYGAATLRLSNELNADPDLEWAQPNYYQSWERHFSPNDPLVGSHQWHLDNTGQKGGTVDADADVFEAWDVIAGGSSSILISVVDDGMEITHPDLAPNLFINPGEIAGNGKDDDGNGFIDDTNGWDFTTNGTTGDNNPGASSTVDAHATSVAGVAAGKGDNNLGITGAAYNSKILPVRIFGDSGGATTDANIAAAVNYAAGRTRNGLGQWTNVHISNHSWGGGAFSTAIKSAFTWATGSARGGLGTAEFISSGNGFASTVSFPSNLAQTNTGIISVGASNDEDTKSDYSNFGAGLTLVSPSNDLRAGYYGIVTTDRLGANGYNTTAGVAGDYTTAPGSEFGGTSSASPLAAGIGALVAALDPSLKAVQIASLLRNTTDYIDVANGAYDAKTGYAAMYGFGRINANTAVRGVGKAEIQVLNGTTDIPAGTGILDFGSLSLGASSQRILRVRNQGTQTLNLGALNISGGGFSITTAVTDASLAVGETGWLTLEFSPVAAGPNAGTLTILSNDGDEAAFVIQLAGTGRIANVSGSLYEDWNGNGLVDAFDKPLANRTVLIDTNANGLLDSKAFASGTINLAIPDFVSAPGTVTTTITASGLPANVLDVNVLVNITHTWDSDVRAYLTGPNGAKIALFLSVGGSGDNFSSTVLDDEAAVAITSGAAPFAGSFRPNSPLSTFDGTAANGDWKLTLFDDVNQDTGVLVNWSLIFVTETTATTSSTGSYGVDGLAAGSYLVTPLLAGFNSVAPAVGSQPIAIVSPTDSFTNRDFFVAQQKAFYGLTIDDVDQDGTFDPGEPGVAGVTVFLDANGNGALDKGETSTLSDTAGRYQFLSRPAGPATLRQVVPNGRVATLPASGKYSLVQVGTESQFNSVFATRVGIAPTIVSDGGGATASVAKFENGSAVTTVVAFDPDPNTTLAYSIAGGVDAALFKIGSLSGALTFLTSPNFESPADAGTNNQYDVTVQVTDGVFTTTQSIAVIVGDLNEAPAFVAGANPPSNEDAGLQSVPAFLGGIQTGPDPEAGQAVTFAVTVTGTAGTIAFTTAPTIDAAGKLSYEVAANTNGSATISVVAKDNGGTANGGNDTSAAQTFTIVVAAVNDAPTFTGGADQTADEDSGLHSVVGFASAGSTGPSDESAQTISYTVSNDNTALFTVQPAIAANGTLTYTVAPNASGTAVVTVVAKDSGGTANGGIDTSASQTFQIVIGDVNDAPTFSVGAGQSLVEDDTAPRSLAGFLTGIAAGPAGEVGQTVSFQVSSDNPSLFAQAPAIDATGRLTYRLAPNANGSAVVSVIASDTGGTANGGTDTSAAQTFAVSVTSVNDAPTFVVGGPQTVGEDAGQQGVTDFIATFAAGPANESGQAVTFSVSNDNPALFLIAPSIDANGKLTYLAVANASGTATVTVVAKDTGGTANGGGDTSVAQTFTLVVNSVNDAPAFVLGQNQAVMGDSGSQTVPGFAKAISSGPANESGQAVAFEIDVDNPALFAVLPAIDAAGNLTYTPAPLSNGVATINVVGVDTGGTANGGIDRSTPRVFTVAVTSYLDPVSAATTTPEDTITATGVVLGSGLAGSPVTHFRITNIRNGLLYRADGATFVSEGDFLPVSEGAAGLKFLPFSNANNLTNPGDFGFTVQNSSSSVVAGLVKNPVFAPVSVTPVNDLPTFSAIAPSAVAEDAGVQSIPQFAVNISTGPGGATDEAAQPKTFSVTVLQTTGGLAFATMPAVDASGRLTFESAPNSFGTATVRVALDDGNGGVSTSVVTLAVTPVNDAPTATVVVPSVPAGGAGPQVVPGVVQFSPGAANETEPVTVNVSVASSTGNVNFLVPPAIDANGNLTYTPARSSIGTVTLAISANDGQASAPLRFVTVAVDATGRYELVGYPEFAVGTDDGQSNATFYNSDAGVRFYSAAFPGSEFGARVASADFTGDGVAELVIGLGVGTASAVQVIDGVTQKAIFEFNPFESSFTGGVFVAAGDVTGDRIADIVVTPDEGGGPRVRVLDGKNFQVIADFFGIDDPNFRGGARAAIGDLNSDGTGDLVVAAGFGGGPRIAGYDGPSLAATPVKLFNDFFAFEQSLRNGVYVAVGDIDGDGISEVIVGGGPGGGPRVAAFSGHDLMVSNGGLLTTVANFFAGDEGERGGVRVSVKDLDGDTLADLVVGSGTGAGSRVTGFFAPALRSGPFPTAAFTFDAFDDFVGGVYVG